MNAEEFDDFKNYMEAALSWVAAGEEAIGAEYLLEAGRRLDRRLRETSDSPGDMPFLGVIPAQSDTQH